MSYKIKHHQTTMLSIADSDIEAGVELQLEPVDDTFVHQVVGDKLVVAYLTHDQDCESPLEWDGEGRIYTSNRHHGKESHTGYQHALGLDAYWEPNYQLDGVLTVLAQQVWEQVRQNKPYRGVLQRILKRAGSQVSLKQAVMDACIHGGTRIFGDRWMPGSELERLETLETMRNSEDSLHSAWEVAREQGLIGDPDAVLLSVYEHSGTHYSIMGEGMQCRWDTSNGGAVWVPEGGARDNIDERLRRHFGFTVKTIQTASAAADDKDRKPWILEVDGKQFDSWSAAYAHALQLASKKNPDEYKIKRRAFTLEYCRSVLESYNAWLGGDCYCVVVERYSRDATDPERWDSDMDFECVGGFIGYDYAIKERDENFAASVKNVQEDEVPA